MGVDLDTFGDWWRHQVYWDQNTRLVNPTGFFFTILLHGVPFAVLYAVTGAPFGWPVLLGTIIARVGTAVGNSFFLQDKDGIKKFWLLPFRDLLGIFVWLASFLKRDIYRRGKTFVLEKGKIVKVR
jgi:ceramide glucosyltransferase